MLLYVSLLFNGICLFYFIARASRSTRDASIQVDEDWDDSSEDDTNTTLQKLHISLTPPATPSPKKLLSSSTRSYEKDDNAYEKDDNVRSWPLDGSWSLDKICPEFKGEFKLNSFAGHGIRVHKRLMNSMAAD